MKEKKFSKTCTYVESNKPGEKIGMDMIEIGPKDRIITAVGYFQEKFLQKL